MIYLNFPNFNLYSMPLLILVLQAYVFAFLLLWRFVRLKQSADLFLALLLLMQGHHCTSYIIGFMDWYDTFRNTKVNYYLIDFTLAIGPLVYFYVKSITQPKFEFRQKDWWHFLPMVILLVYQVFIGVYDMGQPGFEEVQNGVLKKNLDIQYVSPFTLLLGNYSQLLYYAFSVQLFRQYNKHIKANFSNTYQLELKWIRNFLLAWILLFTFHSIMMVINIGIQDLHWQQNWWSYFASALVVLYLGMNGYFTNLNQIYQLNVGDVPKRKEENNPSTLVNATELEKLSSFMQQRTPYLNPELTLSDLAKSLHMNTSQLSHIINAGFQQNFNDFINRYRVDAVKKMIQHNQKSNFSLLGIAQECGFNSKATFNRTFKKFTQQTPSEFQMKVKGNSI